ncbi:MULTISPECIES: glycosyltransferase [Bradyrhizobium]|uniref:Glycosyl transferase n=1 Tax=Bradyrhizobium nanningense TaxID=1325118 RepID=A0A4Q0RWC8_9BRAD|nr:MULTISPECIES: glycosyltransferase [Bradyrhizobium]RXH23429.1 glycosyl transferase [Bradyrhizobium nanningense]RXH27469.1 glycosyl transferase [Bradyrhizobium nanningense]TQF28555.1 glycosyl transferase [Bradyrhizobium sp. UNPA324]
MHHTSDNPRRPSVLHIFKIYYPDLFGGTLTVIRDICASLKDAFASAVLVCSQSPEKREIVVDDVPVERVRSFGNLLSLPAAPTYPWRLWRKIAAHDLLALHAPFPLADLVFAFGFGRKRPLVVHWHADIVTHAGLRWFVEPLMRRTLQRAKAIVVSDHVLVDNTPLLREFEDKCHVVPFGIDTSGYDWPKIEPHHVNDRGRLVLACGRLVPYKGFDVLVRAAAAHNFEVWIIGEGTERPRLVQLIEELGLAERVRLLGSVNDCERIKLMCLADVFVMPSVTNAETFGLVQLEAMAAGRPVVNTALDTAVPRVARHGMEAITVPPGDAEMLGEAIDMLIRDPERRRRMGLAARNRALTRYSATAFKQGMETVYRDAVAAPCEQRSASAERPQAPGWLDSVRIAATLAWSDMRHRYVRSLLGPFWMSLQMAIVVAVLGSVIGQMSNADVLSRLPMLALSMTAWTFLNSVVLDATTALQNSASLIRDRALPPVIFLLQCTFRQGLFALHNACVPLVLWLILSPHDLSHALAALPGLLLFVVCTFALSLVLGAMATRYRDLKPIIESTLMLAFLASPVIWSSDMINHRSTVMRLNPLTHLFAVWREPLVGGQVDPVSIVYVLVALVLLVIASMLTLVHLRKAAFWI